MPGDDYELTQRAHCDLEEVDDYLARRDVKAARDFIFRIVEIFELLAEHPEIGRRRPELKTGLRSFPVGNYVVYYRVADRRVQILRDSHGARDAKALLAFLEE